MYKLLVPLTILVLASSSLADDDKGFDESKAKRLCFILEESPEAGPIFDKVYALHKKAGQLSRIVERYTKLVEAKSKEAAPYFILGRLHERERELRTAVRIFEKGLPQAKDLPLERYFYFRIGTVYNDLQRYKAATKALTNAEKLAKEPQLHAAILEELGRVYIRTGRRDEAARAWRRILTIRHNDLFATTHVANLLAKEKLFDHVQQLFNEAVTKTFVKDPAAVLKLRARQGEILEKASRHEEAAKAYQIVIARTRSGNWLRKQVKARLRRMYFTLGHAYKLIDFHKKSLAERPHDIEPVIDLADAYEVMGAKNLARRFLTDQRSKHPLDITIRERLLHLLGGPMLYKKQTTVLPLAKKDQEPSEEDPENPKAKTLPSQEDLELEELFFDPEEWSPLRITVLKELIALSPTKGHYYQALATELLKIGQSKQAQTLLDKLQKRSKGPQSLLQSAKAYQGAKQFEKALALLERAIKEAPGEQEPLLAHADLLLELGRKKMAIQSLARAAGSTDGKIQSLDPFSLRTLSTLLEERRLLHRAAEVLARSVEADKELANREDLLRIGQLYQRAEKPLLAGKWLLAAFEVSSSKIDRETALEALRENLTTAPQLEWLTHVLQQQFENPKTAPADIITTLAAVLIDRNLPQQATTLLEEAAGGPPALGFAAEYALSHKTPSTKPHKRILFLRALIPLYSGESHSKPDILKAFSALRELARIDPPNRWKYALSEGNAQFQRKHLSEARSIFRQVLSSAPANAPVFSDLARRFGELDLPKEALQAAQKSVLQEPRDGRRHWLLIDLSQRFLNGQQLQTALLEAYRQFLRSGVNSRDLEQARDNFFLLLLASAEDLANRGLLPTATQFANEARGLATTPEERARSQLFAAKLQLHGPKTLEAIETLQGCLGRYQSEWVTLGKTRTRARLLAEHWLQSLPPKAKAIHDTTLRPRGLELLSMATKHRDKQLLQRLSLLFPYFKESRLLQKQRCQSLIQKNRHEEALWILDNLRNTSPTPDPLEASLETLRKTCLQTLLPKLPSNTLRFETSPRMTLSTGALNTRDPMPTIKPIIYGRRLFHISDHNQIIATDLHSLLTKNPQKAPKTTLAAEFQLGAPTPPATITYSMRQASNYYYNPGNLGIASIPFSRNSQTLKTDKATIWIRKFSSVQSIKTGQGRLFIATNSVQCLSPRTGHTLWRFGDPRDQQGKSSSSTPRTQAIAIEISKNKVFALFSDGLSVALHPKTGELLWHSSDLGKVGEGSLQLHGKGSSAYLIIARKDHLHALSASSGKRLWTSESISAAAARTASKTPTLTPLPSNKALRPTLRTPSTPKTKLRYPPPGSPRISASYPSTGSTSKTINILNPPQLWVSKQHVIVHNQRGSIVAFDLTNGKTLGAHFTNGNPFVEVHDQHLYIVKDSKLTIINLRDFSKKAVTLSKPCVGQATISNNQLLIPSQTHILTLSLVTGRQLYSEPFNEISEISFKTAKATKSPVHLQRIGPFLTIRGPHFLLIDPETGKRLLHFPMALPRRNRKKRIVFQGTVSLSDKALLLLDNRGALHVFAPRK